MKSTRIETRRVNADMRKEAPSSIGTESFEQLLISVAFFHNSSSFRTQIAEIVTESPVSHFQSDPPSSQYSQQFVVVFGSTAGHSYRHVESSFLEISH